MKGESYENYRHNSSCINNYRCHKLGLIGIFNFNLVETVFGGLSVISRIIYILVGISGLWGIKLIFNRD